MKKTKIILLILGILIIVLGATYAIYTWSGLVTVKGTAECFDVTYVKGRNIGSNENKATLELGNSAKDGLSSTAMLSLNNKCTIKVGSGTVYLDVDSTTSDILITSGILKYQVVYGNTFLVDGTITSKGRITLYNDVRITDRELPLTVVVWLDSSKITDSNKEQILSSTFSGKINVKVESRRA